MKITKFLCMAMAMLASVNLFTACDDDDEEELDQAVNDAVIATTLSQLVQGSPYYEATECIYVNYKGKEVALTEPTKETIYITYADNKNKNLTFSGSGYTFNYGEDLNSKELAMVNGNTLVGNWESTDKIQDFGCFNYTVNGEEKGYSISFYFNDSDSESKFCYQLKDFNSAYEQGKKFFESEEDAETFMKAKMAEIGLTEEIAAQNPSDLYAYEKITF